MKAEVTSKVLKFDEPFPWLPKDKSIYIRSAYEDIYTILEQDERHYMIVGNPGTGKSYFAIYVLYRALRASKTVVFHRCSESTVYLFKPGQKAKTGRENSCTIPELTSSEMLYLYDAGTRKYALQPTQGSRLIAFSSPSHENTRELCKLRLVSLHMPTWSMNELFLASELDHCRGRITDTLVKDLFEKFGGIARYVLEVNPHRRDEYIRMLESKIVCCTLDTIQSVGYEDIDEQSHMIFHRHSGSDIGYFKYEWKFASQYVGDKVVETISRKGYDDMKAFALRGDLPSEAASLRGWILERIVHDKLPKGGTYHVRKLSDNKEEERKLPEMNLTVFDKLEEVDLSNLPSLQYLRPKSKIFEAADALCLPNGIFQVTVSTSHPIKANCLKKLIKELKKHKDWTSDTRVNYYFVVPPNVYESFNREQDYHTAEVSNPDEFTDVDQYVLNFDF